MSHIGEKPVFIPQGVRLEHQGASIKITGPLGTAQLDCHPLIKVLVGDSDGKIVVENTRPDNRQAKQIHGTTRALIANMVLGVSKGYEKKLEIYGAGYSVKEQGGKLVLHLGFANQAERPIPKGLKVHIEVPATRGNDVPARFTISGIDKALVGEFSAEVRKIKPPEPYKGKGIRYAGEHVRHKVGKAFTSGTT
jgi:large subunit ribosomal protein L6